jgi:hypothetical protein
VPLPHEQPKSEALVPLTPPPAEPFPDTIPAETFRGLSRQESTFVLRYLEHGNATRALQESGLRSPHKENGAWSLGHASELLHRPKIQAALARAQAFFAYHIGLQAWQILGALRTQAFLDPVEMYEQNGDSWEAKPMGQWPLYLRQCVQRVTIKEWESEGGKKRQIDVEFTNRQQALFLLGKHLKLYEKTAQQVAPFTLVLNTSAPETPDMKSVGETIEGINFKIQMPPDLGT